MLENRTPAGATIPLRDRPTVTADGETLATLPEGASLRDFVTHADDRGSVFEIYDPRWGWHEAPMVFAYVFTVRPGAVKGWELHEHHDDRYCALFGELEVVLYDARSESSTFGLVAKVVLSEHRRRALCIPAGVWHANRTLGSRDAVVVNLPSEPYDHEAPDKLRLPLDTPEIPHSFDGVGQGW